MGNAREFVERFLAVQQEQGCGRPLLPTAMVGAWQDVVESCEAGYDMDFYEYQEDISIRSEIEVLLRDPALAEMPEMDWVRRDVAAVDQRFKQLQSTDELPLPGWWARRPPKRAGRELVEDFRRQFGVDIDVVEGC